MEFVDTNILLYAVSRESADREKAERAHAIVDAGGIALSTQVLQEFYVQATRPTRSDPLDHASAHSLVQAFLRFPVQPLTTRIVLAAIATCERFRISYWDAAILEAARALGCRVVLSEDLSDGQDYDGVRVANPFAA